MYQLEHSVSINATKEEIWKVLIDVNQWKQWDKDVKSAQLHGSFAAGTKGTLVSMDDKISTFFITHIQEPDYYSNYYQYPFFSKLNFTHQIEELASTCRVTFLANFSGLLGKYFFLKQKKAILSVMKQAMANLVVLCTEQLN
ncbi:MAG TPA: SRPBCC family protein [Gammaproteobacteria bacterium]|nr:SRPBCC family protein [Gammaproteobacteria bacterium]